MDRIYRIVLGVCCLIILFIRVTSGEAFELELGFTEVDEQSYLDASRVQVVDGMGCMLRDESFHRLEFDHHLFFDKEISLKVANPLFPKADLDGLLRLNGES